MLTTMPSRRLRRTPFSEGVEAAGVKAYTIYNRMLLPNVFESLEADYRHLKRHVQVWDVSCERQVEIRGADAARLVQSMTPRDISRATVGQAGTEGASLWIDPTHDLVAVVLCNPMHGNAEEAPKVLADFLPRIHDLIASAGDAEARSQARAPTSTRPQ